MLILIRKVVLIMELEIKRGLAPVEVVTAIMNKSYDPDSFGSLENYITWLQNSLWKFNSIGVSISGETLEEKCFSLVCELEKHNLIKYVD